MTILDNYLDSICLFISDFFSSIQSRDWYLNVGHCDLINDLNDTDNDPSIGINSYIHALIPMLFSHFLYNGPCPCLCNTERPNETAIGILGISYFWHIETYQKRPHFTKGVFKCILNDVFQSKHLRKVVVVVVCLFPAQSYKHYKNKTWYITTINYAGGHQRSQWLIVLAAVILVINVVLQPVRATVQARISCGLWEKCG